MMTWYHSLIGIHVHVSAYINGALCGKLTFRLEEFKQLEAQYLNIFHRTNVRLIEFIDQDKEDKEKYKKNPEGKMDYPGLSG